MALQSAEASFEKEVTMKRRSLAFLVGVVLVLILLIATSSYSPQKHKEVLIPDQNNFRDNEVNHQASSWLARRWGVPEEQIYMIVQDSETWMRVLGLLDIQSLSSAKISILETSHKEGQASEAWRIKQGVPHEGNIYLDWEYRPPGDLEKQVAARFYSTKTFWYGSPLGGFAIIKDIQWTDTTNGVGTIKAYQSQKYLPTITAPINKGAPQKWRATQTPVD